MKRTFSIILYFLFLQFSLSKATVFINELMPRNLSYLINEDFNFEGWVELFNSGTQSVDISGCYFSDDSNNLLKWKIKTSGLLQPGQFVVIYFDELDKANHASFKLKPEGGILILSDSGGNLIDRLAYAASHRNISYGRKTDGGTSLEFLLNATPGKSNNGTASTFDKIEAPSFDLPAGFYPSAQQVTIKAPAGARIYYTTDGSEPQADKAILYTAPVPVANNTPLRAIAVIAGSLPSDITTASYFINSGSEALPVVSLVTGPDMFYGDEIGMLVAGKNGSEVPDYCMGPDAVANYWNDWDRPCNFEFFDEAGKQQLNQEVKVGNYGNCSRTKYVKSIKINTTKAHGGENGNRLDYALFQEKPNLKWKSIVLRNSGNDFGHSFLRDAFMQQIVAGKMDVDYQAYQPAVVFVNGEYYGMLNIRERTNKDFIYSNYGLDEGEFDLVEYGEGDGSSDEYWQLVEFARKDDMTTPAAYERIISEIELGEFLNYFIAQIYYANTDWPGGNIKAWKRKENGKWRWILYDTDFGFSLYSSTYSQNTITKAAGHPFFAGFLKNEKIKEQFITRFVIHLETTFDENRVINLLNEIVSYIEPDALEYENYLRYTDSGWKMEVGSWEEDIEKMRTFARQRPANIYRHLKSYFKLGNIAPVRIHSNVANVTYLLNDEKLDISDFSANYFEGQELRITPVIPGGYRFKHWEIRNTGGNVKIDTQLTCKETFSGGDYKAILEPDPGWQEPLLPKLYLNEICATNSQYVDEFFESDDWIELYNDDITPVDIGGMYISDSREDLKKYRIPADEPFKTTIAAKGYLIIWADGQPEQGALHTNFSLSTSVMETVSLSQEINGHLHVIDSVSYKSHVKGETFARFSSDLDGEWKLTSRPTFAAPNVFAIPTTGVSSVFSNGEHIAAIYPNPVSGMLWFSLTKYQTVNVKIVNLTGNSLVECQVSNGDGIDVSFLPAGLYLAVIHSLEGKQVLKFIKK